VLFVATGATGIGHIGSRSLVEDPAVPIEDIAGVVSLRGVGGRAAATGFVALGADGSDLGGFVRLAAAPEHVTVSTADPGGWFLRMDHLPFVEAGVPSVAVGAGEVAASGPAPFTGLAQQARLLMRLAFLIGEADAFPEWTTDSEFRPAADRLRLRRLGRSGSGAPGK
jgi:Zn-dependent M28 family amino/carboxypeptidase